MIYLKGWLAFHEFQKLACIRILQVFLLQKDESFFPVEQNHILRKYGLQQLRKKYRHLIIFPNAGVFKNNRCAFTFMKGLISGPNSLCFLMKTFIGIYLGLKQVDNS